MCREIIDLPTSDSDTDPWHFVLLDRDVTWLRGVIGERLERRTALYLACQALYYAKPGTDVADSGSMLADMLCAKNRAYGDSALEPLACFARSLAPVDGIALRLDDNVKRLVMGHAAGEDPLWDIAGYLVLYVIALDRASQAC